MATLTAEVCRPIFFDLLDRDPNRGDLIDRFAINVTLQVGTFKRDTYYGIFGVAEVDASLLLCSICQLQVTIYSVMNPNGSCADSQCSTSGCCDGNSCPENFYQYYIHYYLRAAGTPVSYERVKNQGNCSTLNATSKSFNTSDADFILVLPIMEWVNTQKVEWKCDGHSDVEIYIDLTPSIQLVGTELEHHEILERIIRLA